MTITMIGMLVQSKAAVFMEVQKVISPKFTDFITNWSYETYLLLGGYGSGKSYHIVFKLILKCLKDKVKVLVVRQVYETIKESCYDLFTEIISDLGIENLVKCKLSPLGFEFVNGSRVIFKGMDKPAKLKSLNGVSIVWLEECSEIHYSGYTELLGRVRTKDAKMHFILSCNPVAKENWVYRHFFAKLTDEGKEIVNVSDEELYKVGLIIKGKLYIHHSLPDDNPFLPKEYLERLDDIRKYDKLLWQIARWGRFGATGTRVLPQFEVAKNAEQFKAAIYKLPESAHYFGFDFGFEESFNAVISCAVDIVNRTLYIYDEIYINKITDDIMAELPKMQKLKEQQALLIADSSSPKDIKYYQQCGFKIRACRNRYAGSRLANTRKIKRFKHVVCSPKCVNTIRELKELTYKKDNNGNTIYDEFNLDSHAMSAIWYALDTVTVADVKERKRNSEKGAI